MTVGMGVNSGKIVAGDTGYKDRIGIYELLVMTPEIKRLIALKDSAEVVVADDEHEIEALPVEAFAIAGVPDLMHHKYVIRDGAMPLLFVCEEAHRYAPADKPESLEADLEAALRP